MSGELVARVPRTGPARHLVVMAAGTGGHVMPGLAVAREVLARGWTVSWLGTRTGMENRLVPPSGIPLDTIDFAGVRGKGLLGNLKGMIKLLSPPGPLPPHPEEARRDRGAGHGRLRLLSRRQDRAPDEQAAAAGQCRR